MYNKKIYLKILETLTHFKLLLEDVIEPSLDSLGRFIDIVSAVGGQNRESSLGFISRLVTQGRSMQLIRKRKIVLQLEEEIRHAEQKLEQSKKVVDEIDENRKDLEEKNKDLKHQKRDLEFKKQGVASKIYDLTKERKNADLSFNSGKITDDQYKALVKQIEDQNKLADKEMQDINQLIKKMVEEINKLEKEIDLYKKQYRNKQQEYKELYQQHVAPKIAEREKIMFEMKQIRSSLFSIATQNMIFRMVFERLEKEYMPSSKNTGPTSPPAQSDAYIPVIPTGKPKQDVDAKKEELKKAVELYFETLLELVKNKTILTPTQGQSGPSNSNNQGTPGGGP